MIPHIWFGGVQLVENLGMTIDGTPYAARRTIRERLFSLPWRPLKRTKMITPRVPDPKVVLVGGKIIGHPETLRALQQLGQEAIAR